MIRLAMMPPILLSVHLAVGGCLAIPYDCPDGTLLTTVPDGGIDPTLSRECRGRCDPARCPVRAVYDPTTCDCNDVAPDASASPSHATTPGERP